MEYILSCCSPTDLNEDYFKKRNIYYINYQFYIDGKLYEDDFGKTISYSELYQKMMNGSEVKTTQINIDRFEEYFESLLKVCKNVVHLGFSSGLSGCFNSACIARDDVLERHPDCRIELVDSLSASSGYGLFVDMIADLRDKGMNMDELIAYGNSHRLNVHDWFFSTDLTYYIKGGRISKVSGWFGTALKICPLLNMDREGHLVPRQKCRGKKAVIQAIVDEMEKNCENGLEYSGKCFLSHSDCIEDANSVATEIENKFKNLNGKVFINSIGTTIGSHTGPGTVAVFFIGREREQ